MSNLFDLNNVLKQMHDTVIDVFEFNEMDFKTRICENSCSVYCDQITDEDYERKLGNEGYIEFKYSHENGLELIVKFSEEMSQILSSRLERILKEESAGYTLEYFVNPYVPGQSKLGFNVKRDIEFEEHIGMNTDILGLFLMNVSMAI